MKTRFLLALVPAMHFMCAYQLSADQTGTILVDASTACANGGSFRIRYMHDVTGETITNVAVVPAVVPIIRKSSIFVIDQIQPTAGAEYVGPDPVVGQMSNSGTPVAVSLQFKTGPVAMLASSSSSSMRGEAVTFTASVAGLCGTAGVPTGTVVFLDGATALSTNTLDGAGAAAFSTSSLGVGVHSITAAYSGDANFSAVTSTGLRQIVNAAPHAITSLDALPGGGTQIRLAGAPGQVYLIQATATLSPPSWTTIATNVAGVDGLVTVVDPDAVNFAMRFYRSAAGTVQ